MTSAKKKVFEVVGKYLRDKRENSNLSQLVVAEELGYSGPQFISNMERGVCSLPLSKLRILVDLYKLSPHELSNLLVDQQRRLILASLTDRGSRATARPSARASRTAKRKTLVASKRRRAS